LITISDNGQGIPQEKQRDLFSLFKSFGATDRFGNKGTGLGLATVKRIVDRLDGEIYLDSNYKDGARFTLSLPIMELMHKATDFKKSRKANY
jgi:signal transduction histidine kinase